MMVGPPSGSYLSRGGPGGHCRYPRTGVPLLLCLGKSLVVILNYALTDEQPVPCGPEPYSPGKQPRTRSPLGDGPVMPRVVSQNKLGASDLPRSPGPLSEVEPTTRLRLVRSRHVSAGAGTRAGPRGFHWKPRLPTAFNTVCRTTLCHGRA
jgi:hypothetical protein